MFEALVRTVDAIDPTVCVEARASRFIANSSFSLSTLSLGSCQYFWCHSSRRFFIQNLHTKYVMSKTTAIPPTTPPAIGPADDLRGEGLGDGAFALAPMAVHCVEAQAVQEGLINVQVSLALHVGHDGFSFGSQFRHLRKRPR